MDYSKLTRDELICRIEELELFNQELLKEKEQAVSLEYAWTGNLGHWYWNVKSNKVTFNPLKVTTLGYDESEIPDNVTYQYFTDKLHPDDYEKVMDAMRAHLSGEADVYEVEYRIKTKAGGYKYYYDRGKVTKFDKDKKPAFLAGIVFDVTKRRETEERLRKKNKRLQALSYRDGLTDIYNHRTMIEQLRREMKTADETKSPLSIALFDIDDFKEINDEKGHVFGDQVLIDVSQTMLKAIRKTDLVGRYGGEEFLVIFKETDEQAASQTAEKIRRKIEACSFIDDHTVTVSGGVAEYQGEEVKAFIHEADKNLYQAKSDGKNQVVPRA